MEIKYRHDLKREVLIVHLSGELDLFEAPWFRQEMRERIDNGARRIVLNLTNLRGIDSAGIGVILLSQQYLKKTRGELRLVGLCGGPRRAFQMANLGSLLPVDEDEQEAFSSPGSSMLPAAV